VVSSLGAGLNEAAGAADGELWWDERGRCD